MGKLAKMQSKLDNPYCLMGILLIFWGSFSSVSKLTLGKVDGFQVLFFMFGWAVLMMTVILMASGKFRDLRSLPLKDWVKLAAIGLPQFTYYFFYLIALTLLPAVEASAINNLFPVFVVLFAIPIQGERLNVFKILSLAVGFAGVFVIVTGGNIGSFKLTNLFGDLMSLCAAMSWGVFSNLGKKNSRDAFLSNYVYTVAAFAMSALGVFFFSSFTMPDASGLLGTAWLSVSNIILTYYIWFRVLKIASPALAANLSFFTPFVSLTFIVILIGEKILLSQIIGLLIIIMGTAIQNETFTSRLCKGTK